MKSFTRTLTLAFAVLFSATAFAEDLMSGLYGNTVTLSAGDSLLVSYFYDENGDFSYEAADGSSGSGSWTIDGNSLCVTVDGNENCLEVEGGGPGDSWDFEEDGVSYTLAIVEGR